MDFLFHYNYQLLEQVGAAAVPMSQLVEAEDVGEAGRFRDFLRVKFLYWDEAKEMEYDMVQVGRLPEC